MKSVDVSKVINLYYGLLRYTDLAENSKTTETYQEGLLVVRECAFQKCAIRSSGQVMACYRKRYTASQVQTSCSSISTTLDTNLG